MVENLGPVDSRLAVLRGLVGIAKNPGYPCGP